MENKLYIVGIGPGEKCLRTLWAEEAIKVSSFVVGHRPYLELIRDLLSDKESFPSTMGKEVERIKTALSLLEEGSVAVVSSGDPNVYGMAGLALELAPESANVEIIPGVTSFTAAACRAGVVFRDSIAVISLSDLLTPWKEVEGRIKLAAENGMPLALYNPKSRKRDWQLIRALDICGERRVLIAKNVSKGNEEMLWTSARKLMEDDNLRERIDMSTMVIIDSATVFRGSVNTKARINIVGIGPGNEMNLTLEARNLLKNSDKIFGSERYLNFIENISSCEKVKHQISYPERMVTRLDEAKDVALNGRTASILTGGDPSIFSSAWRILEQNQGIHDVHVSPGVSAFSSIAAKAGAPLVNDFVLLSEPSWRITELLKAGFCIVIYNVQGPDIPSLMQDIDPLRPCIIARDVAREGEEIIALRAKDLLDLNHGGKRFTILIASPNSCIKDGRIITRRGYETKYNY